MKKVFLGGTCNESTWRNELIPLLENAGVEYFNPVVSATTIISVSLKIEI